MTIAHETPFLWLQNIEQLARERAKGLPRQQKVQETWRGIAFRVGKVHLVTPLTEIRAILDPKTLATPAKVPGAKPWVRGLANIRGQLWPIIDLQACLGGKATQQENISRLLIINQAGVSAAILVDEVIGIKHFLEIERNKNVQYNEEWFAPFVTQTFTQEEGTWVVFDMHALSKSKTFLEAAL